MRVSKPDVISEEDLLFLFFKRFSLPQSFATGRRCQRSTHTAAPFHRASVFPGQPQPLKVVSLCLLALGEEGEGVCDAHNHIRSVTLVGHRHLRASDIYTIDTLQPLLVQYNTYGEKVPIGTLICFQSTNERASVLHKKVDSDGSGEGGGGASCSSDHSYGLERFGDDLSLFIFCLFFGCLSHYSTICVESFLLELCYST